MSNHQEYQSIYAKIARGATQPEHCKTKEVRASKKETRRTREAETSEASKLTQGAIKNKGKLNFKRKKKWLRR